MAPCNPSDVSITPPEVPSGPAIPGFGVPFVLKIPDISPFPDGFPEDLLEVLDKLQLIIPPGVLKPALNPNFGKDVFDGIMKLLDQFFPFLMLYKFFLPLLNLIICVIEVLCAIANPFKLKRAVRRLFRRCIPAFINLFPIFAMIIMLISLFLLLLALIEYIIEQIAKLVNQLLLNINALVRSFQNNDQNSVLAIAKKLGSLLCIFQNLFVLLSIFNVIIEVIREMLSLSFHLPPCDGGDSNGADGCCTTDVCPSIVQSNYLRETGTLQYITQGTYRQTGIGFTFDSVDRSESWQIFDTNQLQTQEFINIVDAFDVTNVSPKPIFFPTDSVYSAQTAPAQAAYTVDLKFFYNPQNWGRTGNSRFIRFTNCIVTKIPSRTVVNADNTLQTVNSGVLTLAGGLGYEDDGVTVLTGFAPDGVTPIGNQATLENFLHKPATIGVNSFPIYDGNSDGYTFSDISYIFKPVLETLLSKNIITLGCEPDLANDKNFINTIYAGDLGVKTALVNDLINNRNPNISFPNPNQTLECLSAALTALRANMTPAGVAQFQATAAVCLGKLKDDTTNSVTTLIGLGFDPCKSNFSLDPTVQFTSKTIKVYVNLKETNGLSLTAGLPTSVANNLAERIKAHMTFGDITNFTYDGSSSFTADISSVSAGKGSIMISFDNNILCTNSIPDNLDSELVHTLQSLDYQFIYTPTSASSAGTLSDVANINTDGQPRRDEGDLSRAGGDSSNKDGS